MTKKGERIVYGIHPVVKALQAEGCSCRKLAIIKGHANLKTKGVLSIARELGVHVEILPRDAFQKKYRQLGNNQGVVGYFPAKPVISLDDLIIEAFQADPKPILTVLDGVQDPQNLGAIIRSAEVLGLSGLVIPIRRASPLNETVAKCAAGAVETLPIVCVKNLDNALDKLKEAGFWIVGLDMQGETACDCLDYDIPIVFLIGGEEKGIRPILKRKCDFITAIPMRGTIGSLNVSSASAVVFHEAMRSRRKKAGKN
tara:strand:+ start:278 stop:1045 length:768 start_codon:yes stop_codon:yes gene_type:complete